MSWQRRQLALCLLLWCVLVNAAPETPAGPAATAVPGDWRVQGEGEMRWFGLSVYAARLWVPPSPASTLPADRAPANDVSFALELRYARNIPGQRLVTSSIDELRKLGWKDADKLSRWQTALSAVFPDVKKGDVIVGVHLAGAGAEFFHQGRSTGHIEDSELATAFFAIWLDPRTREPGLRARLLGQS
jgi:hypothetical protein